MNEETLARRFRYSLSLLPLRWFDRLSRRLQGVLRNDEIAELGRYCLEGEIEDSPSNNAEYGKLEVRSGKDEAEWNEIEKIIQRRRSRRSFRGETLPSALVHRLIRHSFGLRRDSPDHYRCYPSAGALYPLEIYYYPLAVEATEPGWYRYHAVKDEHRHVGGRDFAPGLTKMLEKQQGIANPALLIALVACLYKSPLKYGNRGYRYMMFDAGHAMQNAYLLATSYRLGFVSIGGFNEALLNRMLDLDGITQTTVYLAACGWPI